MKSFIRYILSFDPIYQLILVFLVVVFIVAPFKLGTSEEVFILILVAILIFIFGKFSHKRRIENSSFVIKNYVRQKQRDLRNCEIDSEDDFAKEFNKKINKTSEEERIKILQETKLKPFLDGLYFHKKQIESSLKRRKIHVGISGGSLHINMYLDESRNDEEYMILNYELEEKTYSVYSNYTYWEISKNRHKSYSGKGNLEYFNGFESAFNHIIKIIAEFVASEAV